MNHLNKILASRDEGGASHSVTSEPNLHTNHHHHSHHNQQQQQQQLPRSHNHPVRPNNNSNSPSSNNVLSPRKFTLPPPPAPRRLPPTPANRGSPSKTHVHDDNQSKVNNNNNEDDSEGGTESGTTTNASTNTKKHGSTRIVHIQVLCARDLPGIELNERLGYTCDPFIEVCVLSKNGGESTGAMAQTDAIFQSTNPDYVELLTIPVTDVDNEVLQFEAFHNNSHHLPSPWSGEHDHDLEMEQLQHHDTTTGSQLCSPRITRTFHLTSTLPKISLGKGTVPVSSLKQELCYDWVHLSPNRGKINVGLRIE